MQNKSIIKRQVNTLSIMSAAPPTLPTNRASAKRSAIAKLINVNNKCNRKTGQYQLKSP